MILEFGNGKIGVMNYKMFGASSKKTGIAFQIVKESHDVGEQDSSVVGKDLNEIEPNVCFEFSNPESVQVVIDALEKAKFELQSGMQEQILVGDGNE